MTDFTICLAHVYCILGVTSKRETLLVRGNKQIENIMFPRTISSFGVFKRLRELVISMCVR